MMNKKILKIGLIFNILIFCFYIKTESEILNEQEKYNYDECLDGIRNCQDSRKDFRSVAFLKYEEIQKNLKNNSNQKEMGKLSFDINDYILDSKKQIVNFLNFKVVDKKKLKNKNLKNLHHEELVLKKLLNINNNQDQTNTLDIFQVSNIEKFKFIDMLSCFTKVIFGKKFLNGEYGNMDGLFSESISFKNYVFNPDFQIRNEENDKRNLLLKSFLKVENKNVLDKKIGLFKDITKIVNDIFSETSLLIAYLNDFSLEQLNEELNIKIEGNSLYKSIKEFLFNNYPELNKNFSVNNFFRDFINSNKDIMKGRVIKIGDVIKYIDSSKDINDFFKADLRDGFYQYVIDKINKDRGKKKEFNQKLNDIDFLKKVSLMEANYSFPFKLEKVFENFLFSNRGNQFFTMDRNLFISKIKKIINLFEEFFNDKNFLPKLLNKNDSNSVISVLLKIKDPLGGFENDEFKIDFEKNSSKFNEKMIEEKFNYFLLMKNNRNFVINFFKSIYSEMASLIVPLMLLKEQDTFISIPSFKDDDTFKKDFEEKDNKNDLQLEFESLRNTLNFLGGEDKSLVNIDLFEENKKKLFPVNKLLLISAMTGSGKTMFMNAIGNSIFSSIIFGFSFADKFILKKRGYHLPINLVNTNLNLFGKISNNQHEYLSIKILCEFIRDVLEKKGMNPWLFCDEIGSTTTPAFAKNMVYEVLSILKNSDVNKILVTHQKEVVEEVINSFKKMVLYFTTSAMIQNQQGKVVLQNEDIGFERIDREVFDTERTKRECSKKICFENENSMIIIDKDKNKNYDEKRNIRNIDFLKSDSESISESILSNEIKFKKLLLINVDSKLLLVRLNKEKDEETGKYYISPEVVNESEVNNGIRFYRVFRIDDYELNCIIGRFEEIKRGSDGGLMQYSENSVINSLEAKRKLENFNKLITLLINSKEDIRKENPYILGGSVYGS